MGILLIRAEDKNVWESRTPLIPEHVGELQQKHGFTIHVQESDRRIFTSDEYKKADAKITSSIEQADIIIGIKEIPPNLILSGKVYLFFSHTIKGQKDNIPLLKKLLNSKSTLLDYERIIDDKKRRLIFFGSFAGDAGAVDILWLIGQELKRRGISSPLSQIKQSISYHSVKHAKKELADIGKTLSREGFPELISPFVVAVFGYGNVSRGAQEVFKQIPTQYVKPSDLIQLYKSGKMSSKLLYLVEFHEEDMVAPNTNEPFSLQDYYAHPEKYDAVTEQYLPFIKVLVNAVYWEKRYPHFVTKNAIFQLWNSLENSPFLAIADISCDLEGAVELTMKSTDTGKPAYKYLPHNNTITDDLNKDGILILAVDNLPSEFARDSSSFFSNILKDFIPDLMNANFKVPFKELDLPPYLKRAVILHQGKLTPDYEYLSKFL